MRHLLIALPLVSLSACDHDRTASTRADLTSGWADDTLWSVLQAQDHRDTKALLRYLEHDRAVVREHAALALASSPDSSMREALIGALKDTVPSVRKAAALAIGNAQDSIAWRALSGASDAERDTSVLRVMLEQAFKAEADLRSVKDPERPFQLLVSGNRSIRTRAAQQLVRMPTEKMEPMETRMLEAAGGERDPDVRIFLVGALKHYRSDTVADALMEWAAHDSLYSIRVSALRALGAREDNALATFFLDRMNDGSQAVRLTAIEQLERMKGPLDADEVWKVVQVQGDPFTQLPLYGLVLKHGTGGTRLIARKLLEAQAELDNMPYAEAAILRAMSNDSADLALAFLEAAMQQDRSLVERTTALEVALAMPVLDVKENSDPSPVRLDLLRKALASKEPGLMTTAAEEIAAAEWAPRFADGFLQPLSSIEPALDLPRDLECALSVRRALAHVKGDPAPAPGAPAFNHPIDRGRLLALNDDQRYRIQTNRGDIVIALEPMSAPGSCTAFDSLATAGYYSGKYFHRVIPNFVAQGGCPRGDGYGSMDWTLRTEIGYEGFTRGAVGLASAGRDTESCQFFIMTAPAPHLDGRYTRFAHVVEGMDVSEQLVVGDRILAVEKLP